MRHRHENIHYIHRFAAGLLAVRKGLLFLQCNTVSQNYITEEQVIMSFHLSDDITLTCKRCNRTPVKHDTRGNNSLMQSLPREN